MGCRVVSLGDVIQLEDSKRQPLSSRERDNRRGVYPYYGAQGIVDYLDDYTYEGDYLLVAEDGENLRSRKQPIANAAHGCFRVNNHAHVIAATKRCNLIYLRHLLNSMDIAAYVTGSTQPKLSQTNLLNMKVKLPEIDKQDAIAAFLHCFDAKITANAKLNGYLEELLLAKCADLENAVEESCTVGDYCKRIYSGGTPSTKIPSYWNGTLPWLSSGETRARFIIGAEKTITPEGIEGSSTKLANRGSIVMASAGQGFTRGQTSMLLFDTYVNQSVVVMVPEEKCGSYLLFALAARYEELRAWSDSTSTRGSLSGKILRRFALPCLTKEQLERFESLANPLIRVIESNLRESKSLAELRDALLPKLMSGEIDVSKVDLTQLNSHLA